MRTALNAARTEIVEIDDVRARWVYADEAEARRAMDEAKKHPAMQAKMKAEEDARLKAEERAKAAARRQPAPEVK